jgi:hypothetical protein
MKKLLFIFILTVGMAAAASGQDYKTALGLRAGIPYGLTVKHFFDKTNALEGIVAGTRYGGFVISGLYESVHWTGEYPGLNWFVGGGAHIGFWDEDPDYADSEAGGVFGIDGIIGLEYTFDEIPLNLSLDILPSFNIFGNTGWNGINGALSVRYVF